MKKLSFPNIMPGPDLTLSQSRKGRWVILNEFQYVRNALRIKQVSGEAAAGKLLLILAYEKSLGFDALEG